MERGREGRRGAAGGGSVSATRRPRTIGFKETSDCDDMVDDVPNQRLRERPKKENSTLLSVQGLPSGNLGTTARTKRRRQGSQETQDQGRIGNAEDAEETNDDNEMGPSDEEDDPPPPPTSRRATKSRPQGKFLEDVVNADLPAIPRKARTVLKRSQEATSPSVIIDGSSHQSAASISRAAAHNSTPSSSSVMFFKPGTRKTIGSKHRAPKLAKLLNQAPISEREVEVVEALFDLSRLFASQPMSSSPGGSLTAVSGTIPNTEPFVESEVPEPEVMTGCMVVSSAPPKDPSVSPCSAVFNLSTSETSVNVESSVVTMATSSASTDPRDIATIPLTATVVTPMRHSVCLPAPMAPPAEAPKRKRPRLRKRFDAMELDSQIAKQEIEVTVFGLSEFNSTYSTSESKQMVDTLSYDKDEVLAQAEVTMRGCAPSPVASVSVMPRACVPKVVDSEVSCSQGSAHGGISSEGRISAEKVLQLETNSLCTSGGVPKPTSVQLSVPTPANVSSIAAGSTTEVGATLHGFAARSTLTNLESNERCSHDATASTGIRPKELQIDLMVSRENTNEKGVEHEQTHVSNYCEREGRKCPEAKEIDIDVKTRHEENRGSEQENQTGLSKELEQEEETQNLGHNAQTSPEGLRLDSRTDVVKEDVLARAKSAPVLGSVLPSMSTILTSESGSVSALPPCWPLGLPSIRYYSAGSAGDANVCWPGVSLTGSSTLDERAVPSLDAQQPYIIQGHLPLSTWKRCASHVYIAHFIDAQQQMNRHPLIQAAYQSSTNRCAQKTFCHKMPYSHGDILYGGGSTGQLLNGQSGTNGGCLIAGNGSRPLVANVLGNDKILGSTASQATPHSKDRLYVEALSRKQGTPQLLPPSQMPSNLTTQAASMPASRVDVCSLPISLLARPGFGFSVTQTSTVGAIAVTAVNGVGGTGDPASGVASAMIGASSSCATGTSRVAAAAANSGGVVSHATAHAQYLQAVMQQGGYPFPFQGATHFGTTFNGPGPQQAAQFFSSPFYTSHVLHSPQQAQHTVSVAAGSMSNQNQIPPQSSVRKFPPNSPKQQQQQQQQQQAMHYSVSSPLLSQKQAAVSTAHQPAEREEGILAEGTNTIDTKPPVSQKPVSAVSNSDVIADALVSSANSSSFVLGGVACTQSLAQDFNLLSVIGSKSAKQHHQDRVFSQHLSAGQQQHLSHHSNKSHTPVQHQASTTVSSSVGLKSLDQQLSDAVSGKTATVGPGPLGLTAVSPVIAPQGHAVLQTISESIMGHGQHQSPQHQSTAAQSRQRSLQPVQHQQSRSIQMQRGVAASGVEDGRTSVDGNLLSGMGGKDVTDERRVLSKRGLGTALNLSRVDVDNSTAVQGSLSGGLIVTRASSSGSVTPTLNLMSPTSTVLVSRACGNLAGSNLQHAGSFLPSNSSSKYATARSKSLADVGTANVMTTKPSQLSTVRDRQLPVSSLPEKSSGPSLSGPSLVLGSQFPRQGSSTQHSQLKPPNRSPVGSLSTTPGASPQAVLAAAMAKSQQGTQQQHFRQTQESVSTGPPPNLSTSSTGQSPAIVGTSLSSAVKSTTGVAKSSLSTKTSYPVSHKPTGASVKRSTPSNAPSIVSVLGPTTKAIVQEQQNSNLQQIPFSQSPIQSLQPPSQFPQPLTHAQQHVQKYHPQQVQNPQTGMPSGHHLQRHALFQKATLQQQLHVSQISTLSQQQAGRHQQPQQHLSMQGHAQVSSPPPQPQLQPPHSASHHQQQQQSTTPQHSMQSAPGSFSGIVSNGGMCLSPPLLTLGTGNNGSNSPSWSPASDSFITSQCNLARSNVSSIKRAGGRSVSPPPRSSPQAASSPSFRHTQFGTGIVSVQQSESPRRSTGSQFLQPVAGTGETRISIDGNGTSSEGKCQEQDDRVCLSSS